ncbi:hypothetical protein SDC9_86906 [bioreactor metagenome]|uniref:Uncharacterized protein n=1 Tax=bioreactor metagenome TaxID=1076179 RepID=A0A644ZHE1_9ZZZZ
MDTSAARGKHVRSCVADVPCGLNGLQVHVQRQAHGAGVALVEERARAVHGSVVILVGQVQHVQAHIGVLVDAVRSKRVIHRECRHGLRAHTGVGVASGCVGLTAAAAAFVTGHGADGEVLGELILALQRERAIRKIGQRTAHVGFGGGAQHLGLHERCASLHLELFGHVARQAELDAAHAVLAGVERADGVIFGAFHHVGLGGLEHGCGGQQLVVQDVPLGADFKVLRTLGLGACGAAAVDDEAAVASAGARIGLAAVDVL